MSSRPTSITIIAVILLVLGVLGVFGNAASMIFTSIATNEQMADGPLPVPVQYAVSIVDTAVFLVGGYFLLLGRNWARYLYVIWTVAHLSISFATSPATLLLIPGVLIFLVFAFFLFRPQANAFFAGGGAGTGRPSRPSTRRVLSFICYVLAGVFFSTTCMMAFAWSPADMAKWLVLSFQLLPAAVFLSIGRVLSPERFWAREVGIVLIVSAAFGAMTILTTAPMFTDPELQENAATLRNSDFLSDYATGCLWIGLMGAFGGLWLLVARRQARAKPIHAPIVGTRRR